MIWRVGGRRNTRAVSEYTVVEAADATDLEREVTSMLNRGWEPLGGVSINRDPGDFNYAQAMVRREVEA